MNEILLEYKFPGIFMESVNREIMLALEKDSLYRILQINLSNDI